MQLLIATDVAARGLDVNDLTHVIHHTLPDQLESYTHRSGRTGRAGKKGISLAFINPREGRKITGLEKKIKVTFEKIEVPTIDTLRNTRISNWANLIVNTKVDAQAESILAELQDKFAELSKDDILKRLITTQLDHLTVQNGDEANLNETHGGAPGKRDLGKFHRYFVNIGLMDGMTKGDLIHFLADISNVDRKFFGDLTMQKNCAYFDVDGSKDDGLEQKFSGVEIEGRSIRVNRDDEADMRAPRDFHKKKSFSGKRRSGGGGGKSGKDFRRSSGGGKRRGKY
jgi:ATP-dependent RNA helicase DeaD